MTQDADTPVGEVVDIETSQIDLSSLVGHEITIFTDQFQGKPLKTKVIMVAGGVLSVDRGGGSGMIDCLISNQKAIVQLSHKGQSISVDAVLKRSSGGKCNLVLGEKVKPLVRRRFLRLKLVRQVKCAVLPAATLDVRRIAKLRWIETESVDFSSGGVLLCLPKHLSKDTYMLLNVAVKDVKFPPLVIGQVRYSYPIDRFRYRVGTEFIVDDVKERHFTGPVIKSLPPAVFKYTATQRAELNRELVEKSKDNTIQEQ